METFTVATFAGRLGEPFRIHVDPTTSLDIALIEATPLAAPSASDAPAARRAPFSIVFRGPSGIVLPQRIYRIEHAALGAHDLFLTPIGPDGEGMRYEAVFG